MTLQGRLWDVAVEQYGFVTMSDARQLGAERLAVDMLVARRQLERVARGVYRFPELPVTEYDPYMLAVLWTGIPQTCLSHDTALAAYDVCDINPTKIDLTVPARHRIRRQGGEFYKVHYEDLVPEQITWWEKIPTVTLSTAIEQCIASGAPSYLLHQALKAARHRGLLTVARARELTKALEKRHVR